MTFQVFVWLVLPAILAVAGLGVGWLWIRSHTIYVNPERELLKPFKCETCDGTGREWLDPQDNVWKPIPIELRMFHKERPSFDVRSRLANTRTCRGRCHGLMHYWDTDL